VLRQEQGTISGRAPNLPPPRLAPQIAGTQPPMTRYPSMTFEYISQTGLTWPGPLPDAIRLTAQAPAWRSTP